MLACTQKRARNGSYRRPSEVRMRVTAYTLSAPEESVTRTFPRKPCVSGDASLTRRENAEQARLCSSRAAGSGSKYGGSQNGLESPLSVCDSNAGPWGRSAYRRLRRLWGVGVALGSRVPARATRGATLARRDGLGSDAPARGSRRRARGSGHDRRATQVGRARARLTIRSGHQRYARPRGGRPTRVSTRTCPSTVTRFAMTLRR